MLEIGPLAAPFPSTTCVSLTSLGTGLPPGMHGIVGTSFRLDDGSVLAPLSWGGDPNPIATQPEPTVLERAASAGVLVTSAAPAAHRTSGLTRAALRGGEYPGADTLPGAPGRGRAAISRARAERPAQPDLRLLAGPGQGRRTSTAWHLRPTAPPWPAWTPWWRGCSTWWPTTWRSW